MRSVVVVVLLVALAAGLATWLLVPSEDAAPAVDVASDDGLDVVVARADELHAAEDHEASAAAYARAAELALAAGDMEAHFSYRAQRGVCLKMLERPDEARAELLPALEWARANEVARIEGLALGNMVRVAGLQGALDEQQSWYDELVAFAEQQGDVRLVVQTLEQSGTLALRRDDVDGALARLDDALSLDPQLQAEERRGDALRRQKATTLVQAGDDEGAVAIWSATEPSAAGLANQAHQLALLGRHEAAAQTALDAARLFDGEGVERRGHRDRSLRLFLSELLAAGELEACDERLTTFLLQASDPVTLAPWRVIEARLALARNQAPQAVQLLIEARRQQSDEAAVETGWLLAAAQLLSARQAEALAVLDELPGSLAVDLLRGWIFESLPPTGGLASDALRRFTAVDPAGDDSVQRLRQLLPDGLPSLSWSNLHLALADADRMRADGQDDVARRFVLDGIVRALRWQALEARARVLGRWPALASLAGAWSQSLAWVAGDVAPDEAVLCVLPGRRTSYLVICTRELGGTTFGIAAESVLAQRVLAVAQALREGSPGPAIAASHELFGTLFDERALADLAGKRRWTFVLPDVLTPVPPAMYVTGSPGVDGRVPWLVRDVDVRLMPHAGAVAAARPAGSGWAQLGEPLLEPGASVLAVPELTGRYGRSILDPGALRPRAPVDAVRRLGANATASSLRAGLELGATLEVSVPALGGGRLGGLLLAPDPEARFGDERIGFLPWRRFTELQAGGVLILDRARFSPDEREHGAAYAATAALSSGLATLLVTRWPLPASIRAGMLEQMDDGGATGADVPSWCSRLAATQRLYLAGAEASGDPAAIHPRLWAAWLLFEGR